MLIDYVKNLCLTELLLIGWKPYNPDSPLYLTPTLEQQEIMRKLTVINIEENHYRFCGDYHQKPDKNGAPVFQDSAGNKYQLNTSWRSWGSIMAEAWNHIEKTNKYFYVDFYMSRNKDKKEKFP